LELIRSIHLNPVRVKLVEHPQDWKWSSLAAYLGRVCNEWLYRRDVMGLFGVQPDRKLLEFLSQAPQLPKAFLYPGESFPILGGQPFVEEVTRYGEPRRGRRRVYAGRKLSLQKLSEVFCVEAGLGMDELFAAHKGSRQITGLRDQIIHAATRIMYYPASEVARFLHITPPAVTLAHRRFTEKVRLNPRLADELVRLLLENT